MNVELPESFTIAAGPMGLQTISLSGKSPDWFMWAIKFGVKKALDNAQAGKSNTPEGLKAVQAKYAALCEQGEVPTKGAGGSSSDEKIANKFLTYYGHAGKLGELPTRWLAFAAETVLENVEPAEKAELQADKAKLAAKAEEYLEAVMESAKDSPKWAELASPKAKKEKPTLTIKMK